MPIEGQAHPRLIRDVERVAVLRANGIGDLIVAEPALSALRAAYPAATITLITSGPSVTLLRGRPFPIDEVVAAPLVPGVRVGAEGTVGLPTTHPRSSSASVSACRPAGSTLRCSCTAEAPTRTRSCDAWEPG
jgi:hypothetical protein